MTQSQNLLKVTFQNQSIESTNSDDNSNGSTTFDKSD